jgi:hypothetical protein
MNIFNRIFTVLVLLCLSVLSVISMVNVFARLFKWSVVANRFLSSTSNVNVFIAGLLFLLLLAVFIGLIILEFYKRKSKTAPLSAVKSGGAMVNLISAAQQIKEELLKVEDISDLRVEVLSKSDGVIINIYAKLAKGLNVSEKMQQVIDMSSKFASENLGFKIIKTNFTTVGFTPERIREAAGSEKISEADLNVKKTEDNMPLN